MALALIDWLIIGAFLATVILIGYICHVYSAGVLSEPARLSLRPYIGCFYSLVQKYCDTYFSHLYEFVHYNANT